MRVPFAKVFVGDEEKRAIQEVLESGQLAGGEWVTKFERAFADFIGTKYAVAVSNGTDGLFLSYLALDLTFGKRVLTTPLTFVATASTIIHAGAIPIFSDVDLYGNLDGELAKRVYKKEKFDGICLVHLYGRPVDFDSFEELSEEENIPIIEDASHAHGAEWKGRKIGSLGEVAVFSLYPTKVIAAGGWGGVITTNSDEVYEKLIYLRAHGEERVKFGAEGAYTYSLLGYNLRMSNLEAAFAYFQLKRVNDYISKRRRNAAILNEILSELEGVVLPTDPPNGKHVYYLYTILLDDERVARKRDWIVGELRKYGVEAQRGYHTPLHKQPLFANINNPNVNHFSKVNRYPDYTKLNLPMAEKLARSTIWLPVHPFLEEDQVVYMGEKVKEIIKESS